MRSSQFPDLTNIIQNLREYVDPYFEGKDEKSGMFNSIIFKKIPVRIQQTIVEENKENKENKEDKKDSTIVFLETSQSFAVSKIKAEKKDEVHHIDSIEKLRNAKKTDSKSSIEEARSIQSPFIQTIPYYGSKGKISKKAGMSLLDFLHGYASEKLPKEYKNIKIDPKEIVAQIIIAIRELHKNGLVHRDIKPENILITLKNGSLHLELADLDTIAFADDPTLDFTGTPDFLPESIYDNTLSYETNNLSYKTAQKKFLDCYALGKTIQEVLSYLGSNNLKDRKNLVSSLIEKGVSIDQVADDFFEEEYLDSINKKFVRSETYFDSYIYSDYPDPNDAFLLLPKHLKNIYQISSRLNDAIHIYNQLLENNSKIIDHKKSDHETEELNLILEAIFQKAKDLNHLIKKSRKEKLILPHFIIDPLESGTITIIQIALQRLMELESKIDDKSNLEYNKQLLKIDKNSRHFYELATNSSLPTNLIKEFKQKAYDAYNSIPLEIKLQTAQSITTQELKNAVFNAVNKYIEINQMQNLKRGSRFFEKLYSHGVVGKENANKFQTKIKEMFNEGCSPHDMYLEIYNHLERGPGNYGKTSFKRILTQELSKISWLPPAILLENLSKEKIGREIEHKPHK